MKKTSVAIFFGGCSPEHSVSLSSASGVIRNLNREKYEPILIGITAEGRWLHYAGPVEEIEKDTWEASGKCTPAVLSPDRGARRLLLLAETGISSVEIDLALPVLHGKNGEDGTLQGLLTLADIPLAGCGTLASALCMDKDRAHRLVGCAGVRVPKSLVLEYPYSDSAAVSTVTASKKAGSSDEPKSLSAISVCKTAGDGVPSPASHGGRTASPHTAELTAASVTPSDNTDSLSGLLFSAREFALETGYPIFVKPVRAGSSYGVTRVSGPEQLAAALKLAFQYDNQVILEENIDGFEVGCAVLGTLKLITGEVDEIELSGGFFDFTEKYTLKTSAIHVPARIPAAKSDEIKETAKLIYRTLGCSGFARVDMFLTPEGEIVFNEVNTIPGFTEHSRYPGMMKAAGYSFAAVLDEILAQTAAAEAPAGLNI